MARIVLVFVFFALLVSCGTMKPYSGMDRDKRLIKTYLAVKLDSVFSTDFKIKKVRYDKKAMRDSLSRRIVEIETPAPNKQRFLMYLSNGKIDSVKAEKTRCASSGSGGSIDTIVGGFGGIFGGFFDRKGICE